MIASVKLWFDDIRLPPEGWIWARTLDQGIAVLRKNDVSECSLDHDLGLDRFTVEQIRADPSLMNMRGSSEQNGRHLVRWMIEQNLVPAKITIHSWNITRAWEMAHMFNDAGYNVTISPYFTRRQIDQWLTRTNHPRDARRLHRVHLKVKHGSDTSAACLRERR